MPETSPQPNPNRANLCGVCSNTKTSSWCKGCPREHAHGERNEIGHFVNAIGTKPVDVIVIAESSVIPRFVNVNKIHAPFADDAGEIVTKAIQELKQQTPDFANLDVKTTYAVLCTGLDPNKDAVDRCRNYLHETLKNCTGEKPPVIVTMGVAAFKALGIKAKSLKDIQSRVIPGVEVNGTNYTVIPSMSTKMLIAKAGLYNTFLCDLKRAFQLASQGIPENVPLEVLTKDYVIPMTVEAVRDVCNQIINYSDEKLLPDMWPISVDTETNTKFPHRPATKIIAISFAWATGKATCIPLWHKDTPYDPMQVVPYILQVLASKKPKLFHNLKYDFKVFMFLKWLVENIVWCSMLGEHTLEEDKKGQYSLKQLTRVFEPAFAAYADNLHDILTKLEGDSQLDNIRKAKDAQAANEAIAQGVKKPKKKKGQEAGGFENIPLADLLLYGAVDADMTRRISNGQLIRMAREQQQLDQMKKMLERDRFKPYPVPRLCKHPNPSKSIVAHIGVPVSKVLAKMEFEGVRVDRDYLQDLYDKLETVIEDTEQDLYKIAGKEIKLNHAGAIAKLLFEEGYLHPETGQRVTYPVETRTSKNQAQTTEKVLKALVKKYGCPFSAKKLIYAKAYKARNTFCQNVLDLSELDGRLHTNYNIHGTATGRLSSSDENMQNIPKKLAGYSLKKIFIPSDSTMALVNADAKAAEIKIFAAYSGDAELIRALNDGLDTHCFFGAKIVEAVRLEPGAGEVLASMGLDDARPLTYDDFSRRDQFRETDPKYYEMMDKFRTAVKRVVFGILYGAGPAKIADTIGISKAQAQAIIDMLFRMFPSIPRYIESTKWELRTFGTVETYFGRRRRFGIKGATGYLRSRAERQAVNFKIQSTSSDIVLGRLIDVAEPLERDLHGHLLITVHDSIAFELPKKYLTQLPAFVQEYLVKRAREKHPWLPVDFAWDYEVGDSYGELKSFEEYLKGIPKEEIRNELEEAYEEAEVREDLATVDAA